MITAVPLPGWTELAALAGPAADAVAVAQPWLRPGGRPLWFSRSSWALAGLAASWARRHGRPPRLWVPGYFCNATLGPVRGTGAAVVFYPVGPDLHPDWPACRSEAVAAAPDLFLLVHTFGRPSPADPARRFCTETGAVLVEDCAHVLAPGPGLGDAGDFVLWSPHKLLAAPHGGLLVCRGGAGLAAGEVAAPRGAMPSLRSWLVKRLIQKSVPAALLPPATRSGPQRFLDDPAAAPMPDTPVAAPAALKLLAGQGRALAATAAARRRIGTALAAVLGRRAGWEVLFDPATITPYRLVLRCATTELAASRFDAYRGAGIPVESWPDMAPEVLAEPVRHAAAIALRRTLLCFPVHQGLDAAELAARCGAVED